MKDCVSVDRRVGHVYVWGSYVVLELGGWLHLFYRPSFVGYVKYFPYRFIGVILLVVGSLMSFIAWSLGKSSRSIEALRWLGPVAFILFFFGIIFFLAGLILMLIPRQSLVMESHGGLCFEYTNTPTITKNHFKTLTEKLEKIPEETQEPI